MFLLNCVIAYLFLIAFVVHAQALIRLDLGSAFSFCCAWLCTLSWSRAVAWRSLGDIACNILMAVQVTLPGKLLRKQTRLFFGNCAVSCSWWDAPRKVWAPRFSITQSCFDSKVRHARHNRQLNASCCCMIV